MFEGAGSAYDGAGPFVALYLFEGNGSGGFTSESSVQLPGHASAYTQGIVAGDFQGTGAGLEVAVPEQGAGGAVPQFVDVVPLSTSGTWGQGLLYSLNNPARPSGGGDIVAADLNGAGKPSIALTGGTGQIICSWPTLTQISSCPSKQSP